MAKKATKKRKPRPIFTAPAVDRKWQAQDDLRTLRQAEEVRVSSGRLKAAQRMADQEMRALEKVKAQKNR